MAQQMYQAINKAWNDARHLSKALDRQGCAKFRVSLSARVDRLGSCLEVQTLSDILESVQL